MNNRVATLGELLLRLKSPGFERLLQSHQLEATFGGGEANVAISLANFGLPVKYLSAFPENPIGEQGICFLNQFGIDTSHILRCGQRMGIYFLESGVNQRPSKVVYDRDYSAIAEADIKNFDLDQFFEDIKWFHVTGITPALSQKAADLTLAVLAAAKKKKITVSIDLNYRKKLWKYGKEAPEIMRKLVKKADILIANEEDCQKSLGISLPEIDVSAGALNNDHYSKLSHIVLDQFPDVKKLAITLRVSHSASYNDWSALLATREKIYFSKKYEIKNIVDRVGSGDSFAAGLIYALIARQSDEQAIQFAVAASCLKHSIPGDVNLVTLKEVNNLLKGDESGRVQR
ncbi:MAG: sugar kinase [Spirochaetes bacterium]|nr:sugar kinase [Spirochaetota bacterium]